MSNQSDLKFSTLPEEGFIRVFQLAEVLGVSVPTIWRWSAIGKLPKPIKLSERVTVWRVESIRLWMNSLS